MLDLHLCVCALQERDGYSFGCHLSYVKSVYSKLGFLWKWPHLYRTFHRQAVTMQSHGSGCHQSPTSSVSARG